MSESLAAQVRFVANALGQAHGPNTMDPPPFVISAQEAHDWSKALYQAVRQIENPTPDGHSNLPPYDAEDAMDGVLSEVSGLETEVDDRTRERDAALDLVERFWRQARLEDPPGTLLMDSAMGMLYVAGRVKIPAEARA